MHAVSIFLFYNCEYGEGHIFLVVAPCLRELCSKDGLCLLHTGEGGCDARRHNGAEGTGDDGSNTLEHGEDCEGITAQVNIVCYRWMVEV